LRQVTRCRSPRLPAFADPDESLPDVVVSRHVRHRVKQVLAAIKKLEERS
jgi:hypothetical protein